MVIKEKALKDEAKTLIDIFSNTLEAQWKENVENTDFIKNLISGNIYKKNANGQLPTQFQSHKDFVSTFFATSTPAIIASPYTGLKDTEYYMFVSDLIGMLFKHGVGDDNYQNVLEQVGQLFINWLKEPCKVWAKHGFDNPDQEWTCKGTGCRGAVKKFYPLLKDSLSCLLATLSWATKQPIQSEIHAKVDWSKFPGEIVPKVKKVISIENDESIEEALQSAIRSHDCKQLAEKQIAVEKLKLFNAITTCLR